MTSVGALVDFCQSGLHKRSKAAALCSPPQFKNMEKVCIWSIAHADLWPYGPYAIGLDDAEQMFFANVCLPMGCKTSDT